MCHRSHQMWDTNLKDNSEDEAGNTSQLLQENSFVTFRSWAGLTRLLAIVWSLETLSLLHETVCTHARTYTHTHTHTHREREPQDHCSMCRTSKAALHAIPWSCSYNIHKTHRKGPRSLRTIGISYTGQIQINPSIDKFFNRENWQHSRWVILEQIENTILLSFLVNSSKSGSLKLNTNTFLTTGIDMNARNTEASYMSVWLVQWSII